MKEVTAKENRKETLLSRMVSLSPMSRSTKEGERILTIQAGLKIV